MKELLLKTVNFLGFASWVEIVTENPTCTYYFGPFLDNGEAEAAKNGYVEDLHSEGAHIASLSVKRCKPDELTIFDELESIKPFQPLSTLSGQAF